MRSALASAVARFAAWLQPKALPAGASNRYPTSGGFVDAYRRRREPTSTELLAQLKETAYTCAAINAAVCASYKPKLYVMTAAGQRRPKCLTRPVPKSALPFGLRAKTMTRWEEVTEHPALALLSTVNPYMNGHDLLELTTLSQEAEGNAYWLPQTDGLDTPVELWHLPSHRVRVLPNGEGYAVKNDSGQDVQYAPDALIHFKYPNPRDPYGPGLSPLRACLESVEQVSTYSAFRTSIWDNNALPGVVISPKADVISPDERDRIEEEWTQKFRKGGNGRALVAEQGMGVEVIRHQLGDLAVLAEARATKDDIVNAFQVPLPYLTKETNLANLRGARQQHALLCIQPRVTRRDEKLNEQYLPLFDDSGRLCFASDSPVPEDLEYAQKQEAQDLRYGVKSINEVRAERGLEPVPWGDQPWLPLTVAPTDFQRPPGGADGNDADPSSGRDDYAARTGRNRDPAAANTSKNLPSAMADFQSRNGTHP